MKLGLLALAVIVALLAATAAVTLVGDDSVSCEGFRPDARAWRATSSGGPEPTSRQRYAERLAQCGSLNGLRMGEVRRMIGRPDLKDRREWAYATGFDELLGDGRFLGIAFSRAGRVIDASHDSSSGRRALT